MNNDDVHNDNYDNDDDDDNVNYNYDDDNDNYNYDDDDDGDDCDHHGKVQKNTFINLTSCSTSSVIKILFSVSS